MTPQIAFLFLLLAAMVYLFLTEKLPVELTAFVGLLVLVFTGYIESDDAFVGFASPAVITMFSIFFISAALLETGVADMVGQRITSWSGGSEVPLIVLLMLVAGVLSAFMNNVAAVAVLLPAVSSIARHARLSPSRLFMPLSFGAILGGTTTLVGTPPNILTAEVIANQGLDPLGLFDFTPIGLVLLGVGILFMTTVGHRLLPTRIEALEAEESSLLSHAYRIEDRLTSIRVPPGSTLDGASLRETRLGTTLDVNVLAIERKGKKTLAPGPEYQLAGNDLLLVDGRYSDLQNLLQVQGVAVQDADPGHMVNIASQVQGVVLKLPAGSGLVGRSLSELRFRDRFGVLVVGIRRGRDLIRQNLARRTLRDTDEILVLGKQEQIAALDDQKGLQQVQRLTPEELLGERIFLLQVPADSPLAGTTVANSRLGELAGLTVIGIVREQQAMLPVPGDERIQAQDELLVAGEPTRVIDLLQLGDLELESGAAGTELESETIGMTEIVVAPRSRAAGSSLRDLHFRDRYGLQVLALQRAGESIRHDLANRPLRFGDALLIHGSLAKIAHLAKDDDFVVLHENSQAPRQTSKAPIALGALAVMVTLVATGLFPIHIAAFTGAVLTVLFGSLTMEQAYKAIEWRAIYLVAAILPVGVAMENSGAALWLADGVAIIAESYGPYAFMAALVVLSSLLSQGLDGAPTVVILAPVVMLTAEKLGISPYPLMMAVGLSASAAFMTPFSHKANLLVMSAGGYRSTDFARVGTPLTIVVLVLLVVLVPWFFPF